MTRDRKAEDVVRSFYDQFGWIEQGDGNGEDQLYRVFPQAYYDIYSPSSEERTRRLMVATAAFSSSAVETCHKVILQ